MQSIYKRREFIVPVLVLALGAAFLAGFFFGKDFSLGERDKIIGLINHEEGLPVGVDFADFWKVWNILNDRYFASKTPTDQEKVWGAINGLTASLGDPYTTFFPPEQKKSFDEQIRGNFDGVGMEIGIKDNILTVISPLKGNPAEKAGVKAADKILKINDRLTTGMTADEAVRLIRGKKGTEVRLTLLREGKKDPFEVKLVRDVIHIPTIDSKLRDDGVFVLRLYNFSESSHLLFRDALREFVNSGADKLILDLRGNPGGYLVSAVDMASWFLPAGEIVVQEKGKVGEDRVYRSRGYNIFTNKLKMVILVDQGSASASEILAGALSEHGVAKLIGMSTFGKGSVQELLNVSNDTSLKVTIARWFTPNGLSISEGGLKPNIEVKLTEDDIAKSRDAQLNAAVRYLLTGSASTTATTTAPTR